MKEFNKFDSVREVSTHNYLALEQFLNEIKVSYTQCKIAYEYNENESLSTETNELIFRGICGIEEQLHNISTWYNCISKGIDIDI